MLTAKARVNLLRDYGTKWLLNVFVETGTADGYTTLALLDDFQRLITIELDYDRYLHVVVTRFLPFEKILPLWGDSEKVLLEVCYHLDQPALYWLDAHYSGGVRGNSDTPVEKELATVASYAQPGSVVLIDDARLFGLDPSYPTIEWVNGWADNNDFDIDIQDDVIRLTPRE